MMNKLANLSLKQGCEGTGSFLRQPPRFLVRLVLQEALRRIAGSLSSDRLGHLRSWNETNRKKTVENDENGQVWFTCSLKDESNTTV